MSENRQNISDLSYNNIYNLIYDFRTGNLGYKNNKYDVPAKYYFKLFFYFDNGGLLDSNPHINWSSLDENSDMDKLVNDGTKNNIKDANYEMYNTAKYYLLHNVEYERAELLDQFINLLKEINTYTPWYFKEISGLSDALTRANFVERDFKIEEAKKALTIKCLPDSIDDRIGTLLDLYRTICYSYYQKKEIVPANLRKFNMGIYIFQTPTNSLNRFGKDYASFTHDEMLDTLQLKSSSKYIELVNCEFNIVSGASPFGTLNNAEGSTHEYEISITYDDVFEERYNSFISRTIGDFIITDMRYLVTGGASRDIIKSKPQNNQGVNKSNVPDRIRDRKVQEPEPLRDNLWKNSLIENTRTGQFLKSAGGAVAREYERIKENYSVDSLIDTAVNYAVDKLDNMLVDGISNAKVSGNIFYNDINEYNNSIQNIRQGDVLGLIDSVTFEDGVIDRNYDGWTKSEQPTPTNFGHLRDVGMIKDGMETDVNKIVHGNLRDN